MKIWLITCNNTLFQRKSLLYSTFVGCNLQHQLYYFQKCLFIFLILRNQITKNYEKK
jgi:hypothetical protein